MGELLRAPTCVGCAPRAGVALVPKWGTKVTPAGVTAGQCPAGASVPRGPPVKTSYRYGTVPVEGRSEYSQSAEVCAHIACTTAHLPLMINVDQR